VCKVFLRGQCPRGKTCPFKHSRPGENHRRQQPVVCKHWLRGLCKKVDNCEFLHEYNLRRMPECWFFAKYGECVNLDECLYLHIDPASKVVECPWYNRGYCKQGPGCRYKHVRKAVCTNFLCGFCPLGPNCSDGHPKYELPDLSKLDLPPTRPIQDKPPGYQGSAAAVGMHMHRRPHYRSGAGQLAGSSESSDTTRQRPLSEVVCYKCGEKGHYANRCYN
ncbi:hypothetical protein BJ684DRAFT_3285, partial [Piptocephalis cylindrospora]